MRTLSQLVGTGFDKKLPLRFECTDLTVHFEFSGELATNKA